MDYEIVFLDSLGRNLPECENNYKWVAYPGLTIDRLIERVGKAWFDEALSNKKLAITLVGTNNLQNDTEEEIVEKLLQLRAILLSVNRSLKIVLGTIIPRNDSYEEKAKATNKCLIQRGKKEGFQIFKINSSFLKNNHIKEGLLASDNLHLTEKGEETLRNSILNYVDRERKGLKQK